jgi:hypothetical protein
MVVGHAAFGRRLRQAEIPFALGVNADMLRAVFSSVYPYERDGHYTGRFGDTRGWVWVSSSGFVPVITRVTRVSVAMRASVANAGGEVFSCMRFRMHTYV